MTLAVSSYGSGRSSNINFEIFLCVFSKDFDVFFFILSPKFKFTVPIMPVQSVLKNCHNAVQLEMLFINTLY